VSISKFASGRSTKKATVRNFHHNKSNIELFFDIFSQWAIIISKYASGRSSSENMLVGDHDQQIRQWAIIIRKYAGGCSSNCVSGHQMLFSSKVQLDLFAACHVMEFSSDIQR